MSMLSGQCARLRSWADQFDGRADLDALAPLLARDLREAADTIISLRDRLQAAELGSGTCEMVLMWSDYEDGECYKCSKCGDFAFTCGGEPRFCPNCGAKVVGK